MTADDAAGVQALLTEHDLGFTVRGRCAGGMQGGAWLLAHTGPPAQESLAVLKICRNESASRIPGLGQVIAAIRKAGYPTPEWLASGRFSDGSGYHIARLVPGRPSTPLTSDKTEMLLRVLESQAGLDPDPARDWCDHVMRPDPAQVPTCLVDRYQRLWDEAGPVRLPGGDMVHGDFNSCNIFLDETGVSGVIDIEALGSGTRVIDYAWLLREAYLEDYGEQVAAMIQRAGQAVAGPRVLAVCAVATVFDIVRFKLRHEPEAMPRIIAQLHHLADDLTAALP
ncbi:hypothetical protein Rhe02_18130 [Rhizocola hellebori]|uniref:Aminoglycoside phosphotransferase domain-containing protein n=1 Tax=Rhizocola hellebori TaxID=1392758 RepID=A0A8J3VEZ0_9ACTN|nr:phosphotransferase [Rhizocola hellebori]GIH03746.1 hypothetical protein Rhe02_18130 [Rhizocola hellebori]